MKPQFQQMSDADLQRDYDLLMDAAEGDDGAQAWAGCSAETAEKALALLVPEMIRRGMIEEAR